ncbi:hypothetical protein P167DRAFT_270812 [Morchella conica CCBAS932]|uniref:Uncharacterized protein n=1 Tax=Morchella conica CCBAS932 TaxID=1392247 RepID=A0A3N4KLL1_9PEZI|nr:hypothetical protein P167DRAFT_270812 [Morchella conica CCBAS932]
MYYNYYILLRHEPTYSFCSYQCLKFMTGENAFAQEMAELKAQANVNGNLSCKRQYVYYKYSGG